MRNTIIAVAVVAAIALLDWVLHHSHWARIAYARVVKMIPRWVIWLNFAFSIGTSSHLVSGYAMIAMTNAILTFGLIMLAWLSEADHG